MRTTVTLDPDVEHLLKEKARQSRQSFKEALNDAIRQGLGRDSGIVPRKLFRVKARPMGLRTGIDPARMGDMADELEVKAFLDVTKRLRKRKSR